MKVEALKPLNHKGKTVGKAEVIELEDEVAAKRLIELEAVKEVKETVTPAGVNTKVLVENKLGDTK